MQFVASTGSCSILLATDEVDQLRTIDGYTNDRTLIRVKPYDSRTNICGNALFLVGHSLLAEVTPAP